MLAKAELYAADVYCNAPTGGAVDALVAAFAWLAEQRVAVINVSLVGPDNAALAQIDALAAEDWTREDTVERLRAAYDYRKRRLSARAGKIDDDGYEDRSLAYQQIVQIVLGAQRDALIRMRSDGAISRPTSIPRCVRREIASSLRV